MSDDRERPINPSETHVLIERARAGERAAFDVLFQRFAPRLLTVIGVRIGGALRAQLESADILQDVLMTALSSFRAFRGSTGGELITWLIEIAKHRVIDTVRHHGRARRDIGRQAPLDDADGVRAHMASALTQVILAERAAAARSQLEVALSVLSRDYQDVIIWHRLEEASFVEIGARLNRSPDACRKLYSRAMVELTRELRPRSGS